MTLIEVLAALMLLGSLAVAMLLSRGRLMNQHMRAEQKLTAVETADALLAGWWSADLAALPLNQDGAIEEHEGWIWRTTTIRHADLEPFSAQVVRLQILDTTQPGQPIELTSVDVVVPAGGASRTTSGRTSGGQR